MSLLQQPYHWPLPSTGVVLSTLSTPPPPTSAPKAAASKKEKKLKLRASCDMCAASKVKCSKEHPICARCLTNGSPCIYGVSRKHGKPGRRRKRNPDGTPFVKASKQRQAPNSSEFGKFKVQPELLMTPLSLYEIDSDWSSTWSPTGSLPATPGFDFDVTSEPLFTTGLSEFAYMDDIFSPTTQLDTEPIQSIEPDLAFRNPFPKDASVPLNLHELQTLKDFAGGDVINSMNYPFFSNDCTNQFSTNTAGAAVFSVPHSPKSYPMDMTHDLMHLEIPMPASECCYPLALSTLESLRIESADTITTTAANNPYFASLEYKSLDSVLSTTKLAVQNVLQLIHCPTCSSDPHLVMLYSSITSKILTWYQIATGLHSPTISQSSSSSTTAPSVTSTNTPVSSSSSSSSLSSPLITPCSDQDSTFGVHMHHPLRFGTYMFDATQQEKLRRQVIARELKDCSILVDAIANWNHGNGGGPASGSAGDTRQGQAQAEVLYDVLGTWLRSELVRLRAEIEAALC